jgi:hypothetical protein
MGWNILIEPCEVFGWSWSPLGWNIWIELQWKRMEYFVGSWYSWMELKSSGQEYLDRTEIKWARIFGWSWVQMG